VSNHDLPEPKARQYSEEEKRVRHWKLISTIVWFVAVYALIHKLLIPVFLKFTEVTKSPYAQIDFLFFQPLWLAYLLHKRKSNSKLLSLLCGFTVAYGVFEVFQVSQGAYEGWLAVSRLLSAVPLAVAAGYIMTQPSPEKSFPLAWLGALSVTVLVLINSMEEKGDFTPVPAQEMAEEPTRRMNPINQECGNSQIVLNLNDSYPQTNEIVIDGACGIRPAIIFPSAENLKIINQTPRSTNIHLMIFENHKLSSRWNMMVMGESSVETPKLPLISNGFAFVYSDNTPAIGITALISNSQKKPERYQITRSPLKVRALR